MTGDQQPQTARQHRTIRPGEPLSPAAQASLDRVDLDELQRRIDRANRRNR